MTLYFWSVKDLAKELDVPYGRIVQRIHDGTFPAPTRSMTGRRQYYSAEDVQDIKREYAGKLGPAKRGPKPGPKIVRIG